MSFAPCAFENPFKFMLRIRENISKNSINVKLRKVNLIKNRVPNQHVVIIILYPPII